MTGMQEAYDAWNGPENSRVDEWFRLRDAAKLSVRGLGRSRLAVTEIRYDAANYGMTEEIPREDAFLMGVQFRNQPFHELWDEGKAIPVRDSVAGDTLFYDLRRCSAARMSAPFYSLQFYFSRATLDEVSREFDAPPIENLGSGVGSIVRDGTLVRLAKQVRPALAAPLQANELYASHLMLSLSIYVCATYGGLKSPRQLPGGLSAWQERASKELIDAHIDGSLPLERVAAVCGLSTSHFAHAFRRSVGVAPHRWLLARRVERAKELLRSGRDSLTDIALACGFSDQSHFTRVFRRAIGCAPGAWKQSLQ